MLWLPQEGPQQAAYISEADETFYGGAAGGGKTDLLIGLSSTAHRKSIIFRRDKGQLTELEDRTTEIYTGTSAEGHYNGQKHVWHNIPGGRTLEFGGVEHDKDKLKYQGRPHDLKCFDELPLFTEEQYIFLIGWNRSSYIGQRCRIVAAGNPPTSAEGEWVIQRWGPWLDPGYPNKATPGELRWFVRIDDKDTEVESADPIKHKEETLYPRSRTFIPAFLSDNTFLTRNTDYLARLQAYPEPLRSIMLYGDFSAAKEDDQWQLYPTAWVKLAQERWRESPRYNRQTAQGCDCSRGGKDLTVIAKQHQNKIAELIKYPGEMVKSGDLVAQWNIDAMDHNNVPIGIDMTGGYGTSPFDSLVKKDIYNIIPINFGSGANLFEGVPAEDKTGIFTFKNKRAWMAWQLREDIDPEGEKKLAIPPDPKLFGDMCAVHWTAKSGKIQVESKEDIVKRIQRSTDDLDAVMIANHVDNHGVTAKEVEEILEMNQDIGDSGSRYETAGLITGAVEW